MNFVQSVPGDDPIVVEGYFAASPARVFRAWTDPNSVMKWFGMKPNSLHSATIDLRPGGTWRFLKSDDETGSMGFEGEYLEIERDARLVFSWVHVTTDANGVRDATPASRVEVTFASQGGGTVVRVVHSGIQSRDVRRGVGGGWEAGFTHIAELFATAAP